MKEQTTKRAERTNYKTPQANRMPETQNKNDAKAGTHQPHQKTKIELEKNQSAETTGQKQERLDTNKPHA